MTKNKVSMPKATIFLLIGVLLTFIFNSIYFIESIKGIYTYDGFHGIEDVTRCIRYIILDLKNDSSAVPSLIKAYFTPVMMTVFSLVLCVVLFLKKRNRALFIATCVYAVPSLYNMATCAFSSVELVFGIIEGNRINFFSIINVLGNSFIYTINFIVALLLIIFAISVCKKMFKESARVKLQSVVKKIFFLPAVLSLITTFVGMIIMILMYFQYDYFSVLNIITNFVQMFLFATFDFLFLFFYGLWIKKHYDSDNFEDEEELV